MSDAMQIIGAAMRSEAEAVRIVSQNVANAQTTAYRREIPIARADFQSLVEDQTLSALSAPRLEIARDQTAGGLKSTGEPLHLAIGGPGYFLVQTADGVALTRRGDFHLSADGTLVANNGAPVVGQSGTVQLSNATPTIDADGTIHSAGQIIDRVRVVTVADASKLENRGDGTLTTHADNLVEDDGSTHMQQGFLESSNVSPVNELLQLMESVRRFETEQKFARTYDGMLDKAINDLGKL